MIILGIDPGTVRVGYALLKAEKSGLTLLKADLIPITSKKGILRLEEIHKGVLNLIKTWHPACLALERLFFSKNQKTVMSVAEARGAILLTTSLAGVKVFESTHLEGKKSGTGNGRADKLQVQKIVKLTLPATAKLDAQDDVFDAIALALTCYYNNRLTFFD